MKQASGSRKKTRDTREPGGDAVYRRLRDEIDRRMPLGFPESPEGSEIELLQRLFTAEEAEIALHLSALSEPVSRIHRRAAKAGIAVTRERLGEMLLALAKRGVISGSRLASGKPRFSLAQFAIGIFEYQVDRLTPETARLFHDYMSGTYKDEFARSDRPRQMRTVPVGKSVTPEMHTASYENIETIIKGLPEPLAVMNCVCRQSKDLLGEPCRLSPIRECCMMFGSAAESFLEKGVPSARRITRGELSALLETFRKEEFVLHPENARNPIFMCACCGCCCDALGGYKLFPRPADIAASGFFAGVDTARCTGCGACLKRCPMDAISLKEKKAEVDSGRCVGCGLCAGSCRPAAITLTRKETASAPPRTHDALYRRILYKKTGPLKFITILLKLLTLRKV